MARESDLNNGAPQTTRGRLDNQINYYDMSSVKNQRNYKICKLIVIIAAAIIPFLAALSFNPWLVGSLGVVIVISEGFQQVGQYHDNWISYRSTCEELRHEKYLFIAKAGPYDTVQDPDKLLAERVESLVSKEHAKWVSCREQADKRKG